MFPGIASLATLKVQYFVLLFLGVSLPDLLNLHWKQDHVNREQTGVGPDDSFDFVVVGSGSAGSVVANRLSEHFRVLLIEAGGSPFPLSMITPLAPQFLNLPDVDWADKSVPQKNACHALENNATTMHHGKGLGGSSTLNYMMYMRGSPEDYNEWARASNDSEWNYTNLLPFFKKMETYNGYFERNENHGGDGPLSIEHPEFSPMVEHWLSAGKELGYEVKDPNSFQKESFFPVDFANKRGARHSTFSAYLEPCLDRKNLKIELYAHVTKVELNSDNQATGVHFVKNGQSHFVRASKEVILSAGALASPKILMLSGVGPTDHLESMGIQTKVDLPVGQSMQDHLSTHLGPFIVNRNHSVVPERDLTPMNYSIYLQTNRGPLSGFGCGGAAILESSIAEPGWPDYMLIHHGWGLHSTFHKDLEHRLGFKEGLLQQQYKGFLGSDSFMVSLGIERPKSRGEIRLASKDPFQPPIIDPNYLDHPDDMTVMLEAIKMALKVTLETEAFKKIGTKLIPTLFPPCEQHGSIDNEDYWRCYVRHWTATWWHYSSTCKMGDGPDDKTAVVDSNLRVLGTKGLRVIDNSIMPQVTNANTNIPAILIGEKGADFIMKHWEVQQ